MRAIRVLLVTVSIGAMSYAVMESGIAEVGARCVGTGLL